MALKLVFLGRLEDAAGVSECDIEVLESIDAVLAALEPGLATALKADRIKIAVNGVLVHDRDAPSLRDGDEVAFLPPVSGG